MKNEQEILTNQETPKKNNYRGKNNNYKGNNPNYKGRRPQKSVEGAPVATDEQTEDRKTAPKKNFKKNPNHKPNFNKANTRPVGTEEVVEKEIDENVLFGRNSVIEVLKSGRTIEKILVQKGSVEGSIKKIFGEAKAKGIVLQEVEKQKLDEICGMERHQGVVAYTAAKEYVTVDEILNDAKAKGEDPFILILDNIQDPHNLGAIIRSAHNAGVHGIIIPKRRAVGLTSTVSKSSAGAIEYMKVAKVPNISQTIEYLKGKGIWVACADMDGQIIYQDNLKGPIGIVIGSEGEGISHNVKNKCDFVVSIPMYGKVTSLNASVAASILVYEVVRQRHF